MLAMLVKKSPYLIASVTMGLLLPLQIFAHEPPSSGVAIERGVSTLGVTTSLTVRRNQWIGIRLVDGGYESAGEVEKTSNNNDYVYDREIISDNQGVIFTVHPFKGIFYVALGGYKTNIGMVIDGSTTRELTENGNTFEVEADIKASVKYENSAAQYTGFGWGPEQGREEGIGMRFEVGFISIKQPEITLEVSDVRRGNNADSIAQNRIDAASQDLQDKSESFLKKLQDDAKENEYFPMVEFSIGYRF